MLRFNEEILNYGEPSDLAILNKVLDFYGGIEKFNEAMAHKEWCSLTEEEKNLWDNNLYLWDEATSIDIFEPFLDMDDEFMEWWEKIVDGLERYVKNCGLKSMVLGISGGIDSTLAAVICSEVEKKTGVELIGITMPLKNKPEEEHGADLTGKAWCKEGNFYTFPIEGLYDQFQLDLQFYGDGYNSREDKRTGEDSEDANLRLGKSTKIANGNIMARLRMMILYHTAGVHKGMTISTGNMTENVLGFFTLHGDEPMDYPLFPDLYKTEVYRVLEWVLRTKDLTEIQKKSIEAALKIVPTDGNGISDSDLIQILGEDEVKRIEKEAEKESKNPGRMGYELVDKVLKVGVVPESEDPNTSISEEVKQRIWKRVEANKFKQRFVVSKP